MATRGAAEDGLLDADRIIGMSGKRICTDLYVSFGVSGSNFHTAGIKGNPYIIAVNTDSHCRMFELADECLCEDVRTALQRLASRLDRSPMNNPPDSLEDMIRLLRDGLTPACESRRTTPVNFPGLSQMSQFATIDTTQKLHVGEFHNLISRERHEQ